MSSGFVVQYQDWNGEGSSSSFRGEDVTSANYNAEIAKVDALVVAIDAVVIAAIAGHTFKSRVVKTGAPLPSNNFAQRELKWLVDMTDTVTGATSNVELAGADLALLTAGEQLGLGAGPGLDLKTAIEAYHRSNAGNPVTVNTVSFVGRNL